MDTYSIWSENLAKLFIIILVNKWLIFVVVLFDNNPGLLTNVVLWRYIGTFLFQRYPGLSIWFHISINQEIFSFDNLYPGLSVNKTAGCAIVSVHRSIKQGFKFKKWVDERGLFERKLCKYSGAVYVIEMVLYYGIGPMCI